MSYTLHSGSTISSNSSGIITDSGTKLVIGESKVLFGDSSNGSSVHSVWDTITSKGVSLQETLDALSNEINTLRIENKLMRLNLFAITGKFDEDEISNIRQMLLSEDEASRTLAESIIENTQL
jgi:hypothetical protein